MDDSMEKGMSWLTIRVVEIDERSLKRTPTWKRRLQEFGSVLRRSFSRRDTSQSPWPKLVRWIIYLLTAMTGILMIAFV